MAWFSASDRAHQDLVLGQRRAAQPALWLLADSSQTGGLPGANRLLLGPGEAGTRPHYHQRSAAGPDTGADVFITLVPGVERFDYFRLLPRILRGELPADELAQVHEQYDVHFVNSPGW